MTQSWLRRKLNSFHRRKLNRPVPVGSRAKLVLERLEDRDVPAATITILDSGVGTLDGFLSATDGVITTADGGAGAGTLSRAALQGVGAGVDISISTDAGITFNDLTSPLALKTAAGKSVSFTANAGSVTFNDLSDSVTTAGGNVTVKGPSSLALGGFATNGGSISLTSNTMTLGGSLNAGANSVALATFNASIPIRLGATDNPANTLSLSAAELNFVTAGALLIGRGDAGAITLGGAVSPANTTQLALITNGAIVDGNDGVDIIVSRLALIVGAGIGTSTATLDTSVSRLEASTLTGGIFIDNTGVPLTIGGVTTSIPGVRASGGEISIGSEKALTVGFTVFEGITNSNRKITVRANNMTIGAAISATGANGIVNLLPFDGTVTAINVGGADNSTTLGLTDAELDLVKTTVLRIGDTSMDLPINVTASLTGSGNYTTLSLKTGGAFTQTSGTRIQGTNFSFEAETASGTTSSVILVGVNKVAGKVISGNISVWSNVYGSAASTIALDGITGLTAGPGGAVTLTVSLATANAYTMVENANAAYLYARLAYIAHPSTNSYNAYLQALTGFQYAKLSLNKLIAGEKPVGIHYAQLAAVYLNAAWQNALAEYNSWPSNTNAYYAYLYSLRATIYANYVTQGK